MIAAAAAIIDCSRQTGSKCVNRYRRGEGLEDRSSRPHRSPRRADEQVEEAVLRARAELQARPHLIGWATGTAASKMHAIFAPQRLLEAQATPAARRDRPLRARAARRAAARRREEARPDHPSATPRHRRPLETSQRSCRMAVPVRGERRRNPARFARIYPDETPPPRPHSSPPVSASTGGTGSGSSASSPITTPASNDAGTTPAPPARPDAPGRA